MTRVRKITIWVLGILACGFFGILLAHGLWPEEREGAAGAIGFFAGMFAFITFRLWFIEREARTTTIEQNTTRE